MKKKLIRSFSGLLILIAALSFPGCDLLEECGTCELVTEEDGEISYGTPLYFCGDTYNERVNSSPVTVGNTTTYWNCY